MKFFVSILLFIFLLPSHAVQAQIKKGQFIVATEYPKAIIYIDSMRFVGKATGLLAPGVYKVKAWRLGSDLYETDLRITKDSVSILKIYFTDCKEYQIYKGKMAVYQRRRWIPKLALATYCAVLLADFKVQNNKGLEAKAQYDEVYQKYKYAYKQEDVNTYRAQTQASFETYKKIYRRQQILIVQLKAAPIIMAALFTYDMLRKRPAKFKQEPLLTFNVGSDFRNYHTFQLAYRF